VADEARQGVLMVDETDSRRAPWYLLLGRRIEAAGVPAYFFLLITTTTMAITAMTAIAMPA